jgi:hypothetical protein
LRVTAWLAPLRITPGETVALSWSAAAPAVEIVDPHGSSLVVGPSGTRTFTVSDPGTAVFQLYALRAVAPVDDAGASTGDTTGRRGPERRLVVEVTELTDPGVEGTTGGPALTFVVFRPRVLAPDRVVELEAARRTLDSAAARLGGRADVVELPWIEDALAVTAVRPSGADDPRVAILLEQLERAAMRTPGYEHAIWIALVPDRADNLSPGADLAEPWAPFAVSQPAEAALAVAVASPAGVLATLADVAQTIIASSRAARELLAVAALRRAPDAAGVAPEARATLVERAPTAYAAATPAPRIAVLLAAGRGNAPRLRIIGVLGARGIRLVDTPRLDPDRSAGPGAPEPTSLTAVCLDGAGRERARTPIRAHRTGDGAAFGALVAVTDDIIAVELRLDDRVALRVEHPSAAPKLAADPTGHLESHARFALDWRLASGSAREVVVEIAASQDVWVPIAELCGCSERDVLPLWRLGPGDLRARIVATDGWNVDTAEISSDAAWLGAQRGPFVLRRVGDSQLWADVADEATLAWTLPAGIPPPEARMLALPPRTTGEVALRIDGFDGLDGLVGLVERIALGDGDGLRRH